MTKQTVEEKAILRKIESGKRLGSEDKQILQAKLRSIQRTHLNGQRSGIPANAQTQISPNTFALTESIRAVAATMVSDVTLPNFAAQGRTLEAGARSLSSGNGNASFSITARGYAALGLAVEFVVSGNFTAGPLNMVGQGPAGSSGATSAGSGSTTTSGSGFGVSASGSAGASGVSGGAGVGYGASTSTTVSGSGAGTTGVSGAVMRETYQAPIEASFRIEASLVGDGLNPFSYIAAMEGSLLNLRNSEAGSCSNCGTVTFDVTHATGS